MFPIKRVENQQFVGANVQIDGGCAYIGCSFDRCTLVFLGTGPWHLERNRFTPDCQLQLAGPAAGTINFLRSMYANGMQGMVETLFQQIRSVPVPVPAKPPEVPPGGTVQ